MSKTTANSDIAAQNHGTLIPPATNGGSEEIF